VGHAIQAQTWVKGTLSSDQEYSWVALYQLKATQQLYIANTTLKEGSFSLKIPENTAPGMYRLLYDLENDGYVDFMYNNEMVIMEFDPEYPRESIVYLASDENQIYQAYKQEMEAARYQIDSLQRNYFFIKDSTQRDLSNILYKEIVSKKSEVQKEFENRSTGKLVYPFIKSSYTYSAPELINSPQEYLNSVKAHFFDAIDFQNEELINTPFLSEKAVEYVFHLVGSEDIEVQSKLYKKAVEEVLEKTGNNQYIKRELIIGLMYTFAQIENSELTRHVMDQHYDKLPAEYINSDLKDTILSKIKLAIGAVAPEIDWKDNDQPKKLSELQLANTYILVFWSTSCSHCLDEIPNLYEYTKDQPNIHVIAVALEDDRKGYDKYTPEYKKWTNLLGLKKWENPIAQTYEINATPSYFVLDRHKTIVAKPEFFKDVKAFLEN
jgi:thiol-disulfide isomerase/thioredoxin